MSFLDRLLGRGKSGPSVPAEVYATLRGKALAWTAEALGADASGDAVFGVLVDMGFGKVAVTVVSLADSSTSMYTSNGGGVIGGGEHAPVAAATRALIAQAERSRALLSAGWQDVAMGDGEVRLIALTPSGRLAATGRSAELARGGLPLSPLFLAANDVVTQLRLVSSKT